MFKILNKDILVSSGDSGIIDLNAVDTETGEQFLFQAGDLISFKVSDFYRKTIYINKEIYITEPTETVSIELFGTDTGLNETDNPKDFVFDIVLNNEKSLICFTDEIQPKFKVFPRHKGVSL